MPDDLELDENLEFVSDLVRGAAKALFRDRIASKPIRGSLGTRGGLWYNDALL